jgi:hypothetical protein
MTYKQIETSREIRLWLGLGITAVTALATISASHPEATRTVVTKVKGVKENFKKKFKRN